MRNKRLYILLATVLTASLLFSACGKKDSKTDTKTDTDSATEEEAAPSATEETAKGTLTQLSGAKTAITSFGAQGEIEVTDVTLNFWPGEQYKDIYTFSPDESNMFIRLGVKFTNTGTEEFSLNFTSFALNTAAEKDVSETFSINDSNSVDHLDLQDVAAGQSVTGALYYEVAKTETVETMSLVYEGYDADVNKVTFEIPFK